jgi:hypothetical protein
MNPVKRIEKKRNQISSAVWFTGFTKGLSSRQWILSKFQKQVPFFNRPKSRENIPDKRFPTANQRKDFSGNVAFLV